MLESDNTSYGPDTNNMSSESMTTNEELTDDDYESILSIVIRKPALRKVPSFTTPVDHNGCPLKTRKSMMVALTQCSAPTRQTSTTSTRRYGIPRVRGRNSLAGRHGTKTLAGISNTALPRRESLGTVSSARIASASSSCYGPPTISSSIYSADAATISSKQVSEISGTTDYNPYLNSVSTAIVEEPGLESLSQIDIPSDKTENNIQDTEAPTVTHKNVVVSVKPHRSTSIKYISRHNSLYKSRKIATLGAAPGLKRSNAIRRRIGWISNKIRKFLRSIKRKAHDGWRVVRSKRKSMFSFGRKRSTKLHNHHFSTTTAGQRSFADSSGLRSVEGLVDAERYIPSGAYPHLPAPYELNERAMNSALHVPERNVEISRNDTIVIKSNSDDNKLSDDDNNSSNDDTSEYNSESELDTILPIWTHFMKAAVSKRIQMNMDLHSAELKRKNTGSTVAKDAFLSNYVSSTRSRYTNHSDIYLKSDSRSESSLSTEDSLFVEECQPPLGGTPPSMYDNSSSSDSLYLNEEEKEIMISGKRCNDSYSSALPPTRAKSEQKKPNHDRHPFLRANPMAVPPQHRRQLDLKGLNISVGTPLPVLTHPKLHYEHRLRLSSKASDCPFSFESSYNQSSLSRQTWSQLRLQKLVH
ncbi:hypothetical protein FOA43_000143 [Brettanomyces nanus]|uniref:Uncharacterized protein n=1 Tax=Eeniella nana TaxID=13502 RepID=A0A875RVE9_EENNA|nr:uncharacterized protein FOA43_000143 [Brettanomyces nanus]QPG72841.1 hypothetical protein FOA43_000143 [Brettanomyces nanus]